MPLHFAVSDGRMPLVQRIIQTKFLAEVRWTVRKRRARLRLSLTGLLFSWSVNRRVEKKRHAAHVIRRLLQYRREMSGLLGVVTKVRQRIAFAQRVVTDFLVVARARRQLAVTHWRKVFGELLREKISDGRALRPPTRPPTPPAPAKKVFVPLDLPPMRFYMGPAKRQPSPEPEPEPEPEEEEVPNPYPEYPDYAFVAPFINPLRSFA